MKKTISFILFLQLCLTVFSQDWNIYPYSPAGSKITFPVDEGRHSSEPVEWWYTMGHVTGTSGKNYSYMLSYFYYPASIFDGFRILNISDDDLGIFFPETKPLNYTVLASDRLNIEAAIFFGGTETWKNRTDAGENPLPFKYKISAASSTGSINLECDALKPPLILADSGFLYQGASAYTYYYSQTKNAVSGSITLNGVTENVTGTSWIDRQYGTFNPSDGQEYEWFGVQLSNGMDLNIYNLFNENNEIPNTLEFRILSAYVDETTQYTTTDFEIERLKYSYTPDELMCYSQKWRITSPINDVDIIVSAAHSNYEVQLPFRFYEGPTTITGTVKGNAVTGIGFAELAHSYEKPTIQITEFANLGDISTLLKWEPNNPDDGNPLKYDLEYSIDNQQTFLPIAGNIIDTFYIWDSRNISEDKEVWLKVTGYSIDNTVSNFSTVKLVQRDVAINQIEDHQPINIYPNPSIGQFTIEGINIREIEILDVCGKIIYSSSINQRKNSVDLSAQQKGVYFLKLSTDDGITTKKLLLK
ncbi:MAG: T9SS type A sorting domain-containing protein [Bacteroidetes bacterium]|nr:T9SS type A sorting domain-containing protein [Bacteroidota bacterium]